MEQLSGQRRNHFVLKGLLSYPLSGHQISGLLHNFLELLTEHRNGTAGGPGTAAAGPIKTIDGNACLAGALAKAGEANSVSRLPQ
jgi:hypothetical protein